MGGRRSGGQGEGKDVSLCVEDKVIHIKEKVFFFREQKVEVLECLSQDKGVHSERGGGGENENEDGKWKRE